MNIQNIKNTSAFTLIEILVGILILSIIFIGGFQALTAVSLGKVRLIQATQAEKQSFYFTEKFFELIKKGGTLDYEEYFNRMAIGSTTYASGHYDTETGFGNFGDSGIIGTNTFGSNFYYCRSGNNFSEKLTGSGCLLENNSGGKSYAGVPQRYGEYSFQFIDYNSNYDDDLGDEDGDTKIIGDDDDEYIGIGPEVFSEGSNIKELYLISGNKKERTLFRWNLITDPNKPLGSGDCVPSADGTTYSGECLGNIEYVKLTGTDRGFNHDDIPSISLYDGVIDTWEIHKDIDDTKVVAGSTNENYWVPLFPSNMHVSDFKIYAYPNQDINLNWKDENKGANISPYVRIQLKIAPSWKIKKNLQGQEKEIIYTTTISLTDIFSQ